ncbi:uncharacterized protein LOC127723438 isoform X1 [Mytilus californianus]|uniref:uncharacterized protein LOC127723438 isoform X1 n=1 Tax=Mytilus californianus TaxID=6549 RepID=UPI002247DE72|nr:uncharacterized protein LOC127723438 isoform X1 [Mytilus californianus]XP_052086035.1 uncharacterized protein LOC127723438 isoform X1 [Mytilus californianus]XP_052086045.1 uncharacterized protein LOC127723438 isoform X1 [Mytilus californianus]XP_052086054.1 uncharacterized protein LOC127723438 isoform X1 [Mytilus californianus]XP_052086063.1 uncharacterized protein LOC127723438 isoform X1 [Mytilus californianus]
MERQHWCSFCLIPFKDELSLRAHLYIHEKQPPVSCSLCPLTFVHHSQLGNHIRYKHSDYIINTFVENAESIYRKNITDITTEVESDSEWTDSSEEDISEDTDFESVKEPVESISNEIKYILAQNVNDASDNKNPICEFDPKGVNTKHMNISDGHYGNVTSCGVSFLVKLEREKAGRHYLNITRNIPNSEDNSQRHILQQHMKSAFFNSDDSVCTNRPSYNFSDENTDPDLRDEYQQEKTPVHTKGIVQQNPWVDLDSDDEEKLDYGENKTMIGQNAVRDEKEFIQINEDHEQTPWVDFDSEDEGKLDYGENKAMIGQNGAHDEDELIRVHEDHELAVADVVYSPEQGVWKEAIDILKATFMKKKKRARKRGRFATTNTVSFTKWLPANFPVEGVMCGCGRNLKTPKSLLGHLRRKSSTARKNVKLFRKGI